jgi:5,10-methylenetetrahydromethanopterin reductase
VQSDKQPGDYAAIAATAEDYGLDVVSVYGDLMYQPPLGPLLEMATATARIRLGPACLNPYSMHPYEIAGQVATLDAVSQGRAYLGLARGAWLGSVGIDQPDPIDHLADAAEIVARLLRGDDSGYAGAAFTLAPGARLAYTPWRKRVPLLMGTWGPRTLALAAEIADEVKIGGSASPAIVPWARDRLGDTGREVGIVIGAVSVIDEDAGMARRRARSEVAPYVAVVAHLDPTATIDPDLVASLEAQLQRGDAAAAGALLPDDVFDRFAFAGTPADVAEQVNAVFDAGASRVELGTPHGLSTSSGLELIGRHVLPMVEG